MLLHLGKDIMVRLCDIIFIIDYECVKKNKINISFYESIRKNGEFFDISNGKPKSIVIAKYNSQYKVYLSSISSTTLSRRNFY